MTRCSGSARPSGPGSTEPLPLYEEEMMWFYDHRAGTYEGQTERQARVNWIPRNLGTECSLSLCGQTRLSGEAGYVAPSGCSSSVTTPGRSCSGSHRLCQSTRPAPE